MNNWMEDVDFAWFASDKNNNLAIIYSDIIYTPLNILKKYSSIDEYNLITDFVLDEIKGSNSGKFQDVSKGFYIYEYSIDKQCYKVIATPEKPIKLSRMIQFEELIFKFVNIEFGCNINWVSGEI